MAGIIDLGSAVLPGLIDGHTRLFRAIIVPEKRKQRRHRNALFRIVAGLLNRRTNGALMGGRQRANRSRAEPRWFDR